MVVLLLCLIGLLVAVVGFMVVVFRFAVVCWFGGGCGLIAVVWCLVYLLFGFGVRLLVASLC